MKLELRSGLAALALALMSACGGGAGQIEKFEPTRLLSFGDEHSLLTSDGRRYGINGLKADTTPAVIDCAANPIWVQALSTQFKLPFAQCNAANETVKAFMFAKVGAKVADVKVQIDQMLASSGSVGPKDLISILVGEHDLIELYQRYPVQSESQLIAEAEVRGRALADQVNRLANANGRVVVLTTFDIGLTPYALAEKAAHTDTDRAALMSRLTAAFNLELRLKLINDGRLIAIVLADETVTQMARFPGYFASQGLADVTRAACAVALPDCRTDTMVPEVATNTTWLWADDRRLGYFAQGSIGTAAAQRVDSHPF